MTKLIFFLWVLTGKVQHKLDAIGYFDYNNGRKLYIMGKDSVLYKGEILNYIRTKRLVYNDDISDKNGRIKRAKAVNTITMKDDDIERDFVVYKEGNKHYVIDPYFKTKIYLKKGARFKSRKKIPISNMPSS